MTVRKDGEAAIESLMDLDHAAGIGPATSVGEDLELVRAEGHGVVVGDEAPVFEAADRVQIEGPREGTKGRRRLGGEASEALIVARQIGGEEGMGAGQVADADQAQLTDEAVLKGPAQAFDAAFGLGGGGGNPLDAKLGEGTPHLGRVGLAAELLLQRQRRPFPALEDAVAIGVDGDGNPMCPDDLTKQQEVAGGILVLAEDGPQDRPGGIVDGVEQDQSRSALLEPGVMTAVQLDQHPPAGHPLATEAVLGRASAPGAAQPSGAQDAVDGGMREDEVFPLGEEFGQVAMIDPRVGRPGEPDEPLPDGGADPLG